MAERQTRETPDEQVLRHALEKLRARDGLTAARLQARASDVAAPLLRLAAVRRFSGIYSVDLFHAACEVVADSVRVMVHGTDRIVADAILASGAFADAYRDKGIEQRVIDTLRSDLLSRRRRCLLTNWHRLHAALDLPPGAIPSDRSLRGTMEGHVLSELSRQLISGERYSLGVSTPLASSQQDATHDADSPATAGRVVVVGGAVMDAIFHTKIIPEIETSCEAQDFKLSPGGKGLMQAIATARLGLDVSLIAAVTDDRFGREITSYLDRAHVDTSMLKVIEGSQTPFTGVIEVELGDSIAVNWRNDQRVRLDVLDIERFASQLRDCDAVLITFELPRESMQHAIAVAHGTEHQARRPRRPVIVVTPGQPYESGNVSGQALAQIDYLVAHSWELGYLTPRTEPINLDWAARQILAYGVGTLCVPTHGGSTIYRAEQESFKVPTFLSRSKESSVARDAFCASLAAKLIDQRGEFTEDVALWATAAMAAATADYSLPNPMPTRQRVEQLLTRSRFTASPRHPGDDELSDAEGGQSLLSRPSPWT
jgi:ribokinase